MKAIILSVTCLVLMATTACADHHRPINVDQLPETSQQFIKEYFSTTEVTYVQKESGLFDKSYEVVFANGNKIEFNKHGEWKDIYCKYADLPSGVIPQKIQAFIALNHPGAKVIDLDKNSGSYELKLNNRLELKFGIDERFMGYDD